MSYYGEYSLHDNASRKYSSNSIINRWVIRWRRLNRPVRWFIILAVIISIGWTLLGIKRWAQRDNYYKSSKASSIEAGALVSTHCDKPHPGRPHIQYVLIIDAGSTGSRIHAYRFNYCRSQPTLESEVFHHIKPGLSSFPDDPVAAARSLDELMEVAMASVPESLRSCTPVTVKATAGLRLLGPTASDAILAQVKHHLSTNYPFPIVKENGVVIMDGKDEGVYAWITVNYLLGNLTGEKRASTAAIFDLGGGSTQIVFEPSMPIGEAMTPGEHEYAVQFSGRNYVLYQHSYLGFGLMEARRRILQSNIHKWQKESRADGLVKHPCLPVGYKEILPTSSGDQAGSAMKAYPEAGKTITLEGSANGLEQCQTFIKNLLFKEDEELCPIKPCAFDGVYQPSLQHTFDHGHLYIFSYFYDRLDDLGFGRDFTLQNIRDAADRVCRQDAAWFQREKGINASRLFQKNNYYCLDMAFIYGLLHDGYDVPNARQVHMAKKIKDFETGWCVGAAIAVLDEGHYCRVQEL